MCDDFPVGSFFGGKSFWWDDLRVGCFISGMVCLWVELALELSDCSTIFVFYIIRDASAILIIGSSMQVALTCGLFFYEVVTTTVFFPVR